MKKTFYLLLSLLLLSITASAQQKFALQLYPAIGGYIVPLTAKSGENLSGAIGIDFQYRFANRHSTVLGASFNLVHHNYALVNVPLQYRFSILPPKGDPRFSLFASAGLHFHIPVMAISPFGSGISDSQFSSKFFITPSLGLAYKLNLTRKFAFVAETLLHPYTPRFLYGVKQTNHYGADGQYESASFNQVHNRNISFTLRLGLSWEFGN